VGSLDILKLLWLNVSPPQKVERLMWVAMGQWENFTEIRLSAQSYQVLDSSCVSTPPKPSASLSIGVENNMFRLPRIYMPISNQFFNAESTLNCLGSA
jgi:hypothetical protein